MIQANIQTQKLEKHIISSLMLFSDTVRARNYLLMLKVDYFNNELYRKIYQLMLKLNAQMKMCDMITMREYIKDDITDDELIELQGTTFTDVYLDSHISQLKESYVKNSLRMSMYNSVNEILESTELNSDIEKLISTVRTLQNEIATQSKQTQIELINSTKEKIIAGNKVESVSLCMQKVKDEVLCFRGQTVVIGAQSGLGKTAFCLSLMQYQYQQGVNSVYFCCESKAEELLNRLCCQASTSSYANMSKGFPWGGKGHFLNALDAYAQYPERMRIYGNDNYKNTVEAIDRELYAISQKTRLDIVYIDYFQALKLEDEKFSRKKQYEQYEEIITQLSILAIKYNCVIVAISQLNRGEKDEDGRPTVQNLRGASTIENVAHIIAFLYQEKEERDSKKRVKDMYFYSAKTRLIAPFKLKLAYDSYCGMFHEKMEQIKFPFERQL